MEFMNTTMNTAGTTGMNKTFFDRDLLNFAKTKFVYANYGLKKPIPKNSGKKIEMRRWCLFDPSNAMTPLTEGVTPEGLSLEQDMVEATVHQYGAYFTYSDLLSLTTYDEVTQSGVKRLGELMGTVIDRLVRDELVTCDNVMYMGNRTARSEIKKTDVLTITGIQKAALELTLLKAPRFSRGGKEHYIAIVHPYAKYDLWNDPKWEAANTYVHQESLYSGELGRMYGVVFVESTEAPVVEPSVNEVAAAATSNTTTFVLQNAPGALGEAYLMTGGNTIYIGGVAKTLAATDPYNKETRTVKLSAAATVAKGATIVSADAGEFDAETGMPTNVYQTVVFGQEAYGLIDVGGHGIESIIKPIGQAGFDPLNQRGTVGAKVKAFACKVLNEDWILRIEHAASE